MVCAYNVCEDAKPKVKGSRMAVNSLTRHQEFPGLRLKSRFQEAQRSRRSNTPLRQRPHTALGPIIENETAQRP